MGMVRHLLCFHCDALQPGDGRRTYHQSEPACDVGWLISLVGCLGFGSTAGEEETRGLSSESLDAS